MTRYATREDEVDQLLRGRVFVDLHRVVRQGLRASVESYSIKRLEPFYGFARAVDLTTATRALIQVEVRLESGDAAGVPDPLRTEIEGYNRDDCLSTLRLAAWLEECRRDLQALTGQPVPRPALRDEERDREQEPAVETAALFEALTAGLPVDDADLDDEQRARRLLAHLLEFHRREDKPMWWEFFHRCGFTEEEHVESRATLGALTCDGEVEQVKRSVIHRYRFPEQPHEIKVGDSPKNPDTAESDELKRGNPRRGRPEACRPLRQDQHGSARTRRARPSSVFLTPRTRDQNPHCLRDPVGRGRSFRHVAGQEALPEREQALEREGPVVRVLDAHVDVRRVPQGLVVVHMAVQVHPPGGESVHRDVRQRHRGIGVDCQDSGRGLVLGGVHQPGLPVEVVVPDHEQLATRSLSNFRPADLAEASRERDVAAVQHGVSDGDDGQDPTIAAITLAPSSGSPQTGVGGLRRDRRVGEGCWQRGWPRN